MASNVVLLKAALAGQERVLSQYAALNGPVVGAEHEFAHRPYERKSFPASPTLDTLKEFGAPTDKLEFGSTALRSYLTAKKWATVGERLNELAKVKMGTRFGAKKLNVTGDDEDESPESE